MISFVIANGGRDSSTNMTFLTLLQFFIAQLYLIVKIPSCDVTNYDDVRFSLKLGSHESGTFAECGQPISVLP